MEDAIVSITNGNQVAGVKVKAELLANIWSGATPADLADGLRKTLEVGLLFKLVQNGVDLQNAIQLVDQYTPDSD